MLYNCGLCSRPWSNLRPFSLHFYATNVGDGTCWHCQHRRFHSLFDAQYTRGLRLTSNGPFRSSCNLILPGTCCNVFLLFTGAYHSSRGITIVLWFSLFIRIFNCRLRCTEGCMISMFDFFCTSMYTPRTHTARILTKWRNCIDVDSIMRWAQVRLRTREALFLGSPVNISFRQCVLILRHKNFRATRSIQLRPTRRLQLKNIR